MNKFISSISIVFAMSLPLHAEDGTLELRVPKTQEPVKIDAKFDDAAWQRAATTKKGLVTGTREIQSGAWVKQQRLAAVSYDAENLYLIVQCYTSDVLKLLGQHNSPFQNDCVEIHIRTSAGKYFHIGVDINGDIASGALTTPPLEMESIQREVSIESSYWVAELRIPWKTLAIKPLPGTRIGFNLASNLAHQEGDLHAKVTWGPAFVLGEPSESVIILE